MLEMGWRGCLREAGGDVSSLSKNQYLMVMSCALIFSLSKKREERGSGRRD